MSALKPCPFCGGEADYLPDRLMAPGAPPPVFCDGCHASTLDAAAWNRRAGDGEVEKMRAELAAAREALQNMLGAFNTPLRRRRMPGDFYDAAIDSARTALGDTP